MLNKKLLLLISTISSVFAWSPTDSYAPGNVSCPSSNQSFVREASSLSTNEINYVNERHKITDVALVDFLTRANMTGFDAEDFITNQINRSISIGVAFSGGGYRAMLCGAGQLSALDNRTDNATEAGLGGLIQATTYLAGLSGGNWLVGTITMNNWTDVQTIINDGEIWDLEHSIFTPGGLNFVKSIEIWDSISDDLEAKRDAGFNLSLTDAWARALSHQFFATTENSGAALTWSTLRDATPFINHEMPFPIVVTDGRAPGTTIINENSTVFEVSPYELGSWDPSVYAFTDVKYLGTNVSNGVPTTDQCINGFDNAGYIMGTSSTLFNQFILQINSTGLSGEILDLLTDFLQDISSKNDDIADYTPNPFYNTKYGDVSSVSDAPTLYLVDGGEDDQNVPLAPLIHPARDVDVVFAFDNSADTDASWPDGASLVQTYERQFSSQGNGTTFPYVPDINTFRNLNLTSKPTFFGCDSSNLTSLNSNGNIPPLIVYIANRPFSYYSNTSTFKMSYDEDEKLGMIQNGFEVASRLNGTLDSEWAACVGCAIIRREQERNNISQTDQCEQCFSRYCWDGSLDSSSDVDVNFTLTGLTNGSESTGNTSFAGSIIMGRGDSSSFYTYFGYTFLTIMIVALVG